MFTIGYDRKNNVLAIRVVGVFDSETMQSLDTVCATFLNAEGPGHSIFDLTAVRLVDMSSAAVARRAQAAALCPGFERVVVAPQDEIFAVAAEFCRHQEAAGLATPLLVRSLPEAESLLRLGELRFRPVDTSWLTQGTVTTARP